MIEVAQRAARELPGPLAAHRGPRPVVAIDDCPCGRLGPALAIDGRVPKAELRGCSDTRRRPRRMSRRGSRPLVPARGERELEEIAAALARPRRARAPFAPELSHFCHAVSRALFADKRAKRHPELRPPRLLSAARGVARLRAEFAAGAAEGIVQVPRGLAFHVPPSSVDTMFVYSLAVAAGRATATSCASRSGERADRRAPRTRDAALAEHPPPCATLAVVSYGHELEPSAASRPGRRARHLGRRRDDRADPRASRWPRAPPSSRSATASRSPASTPTAAAADEPAAGSPSACSTTPTGSIRWAARRRGWWSVVGARDGARGLGLIFTRWRRSCRPGPSGRPPARRSGSSRSSPGPYRPSRGAGVPPRERAPVLSLATLDRFSREHPVPGSSSKDARNWRRWPVGRAQGPDARALRLRCRRAAALRRGGQRARPHRGCRSGKRSRSTATGTASTSWRT